MFLNIDRDAELASMLNYGIVKKKMSIAVIQKLLLLKKFGKLMTFVILVKAKCIFVPYIVVGKIKFPML